jgi:hypothetical protein
LAKEYKYEGREHGWEVDLEPLSNPVDSWSNKELRVNAEIVEKIGDIKKRVQLEMEQARLDAELRSVANDGSELAKTQSSWLSKSRRLKTTVRGVMAVS